MNDASIAAKKLPPTVYFSHTRHTLTIFDVYPKALFHFLVLPRLWTTTATSIVTGGGDGGDGENDSNREGDDGSDSGLSSMVDSESEADLTSLRTLIQSAIIAPPPPPSSNADDDDDESEERRVKVEETGGGGGGGGGPAPAGRRGRRAAARAKETLGALADEARRLKVEIEVEMRARYGFAWPVWVGFHAVPSME
jgi:aprataxin